MRGLLLEARKLTRQWLAVSIPREYNLDADRLSHPKMLGEVRADAAAAGLTVHDAPIPAECWRALQAVTAAAGEEGRASSKGRRRRQRRRAGWGGWASTA
jgi:hypothetical protein